MIHHARRAALPAAALALLGAAVGARAQAWSGDVNVLLAGKHLDSADWRPVQDEGELGLQTNWRGPGWPVALAADFLTARADADVSSDGFTEKRSRTSEADLGARKIWNAGSRLRPYLGGGLAVAKGRLEYSGPGGAVSDEDSGAGLWIGGGIMWRLGTALDLGLDARFSHADVDLFGTERNAGGLHLGALLGWHWGGQGGAS